VRSNNSVNSQVPVWETEAMVSILEQFSTPFYLYDFRMIEEKITTLRSFLDSSIHLFYAIKANPNGLLLRRIAPLVDGADIASGGELQFALESGFSPSRLSFAGPGKKDPELLLAIQHEIGSISIESLNELKRIDALAKREKKRANVSIRVNPRELIPEFALKMGGRASPFGIDEDALDSFFDVLRDCSHVQLIGLHVYAGTQCLDAEALFRNFQSTFKIAERLIDDYKVELKWINLGGGFGVPYYEGQKALDVQRVCENLRVQFFQFKKKENTPNTVGILELGRFLIAEAGIYVVRILDKKVSRGKTYCILEGGINHHLSASGHLGQVIRKNFKVVNLSKKNSANLEEVTLTGPLCTSIDVMADRVLLPTPEIGDVLAFFTSGAYGYSASPLFFLSHETPKELLVDKKGIHVIREAFLPGK